MTDRTTDGADKNSPRQKRRTPRRITESRLRNIALHHLERFSTSAENMRNILLLRVRKAARHHETDTEQAKAWIDDIVGGLVRTGAIDDKRYATGKAESMIRRGQSPARIRAFLRSKGVDGELIDDALTVNGKDADTNELHAALAYALRRRMGPYRTKPVSAEAREKELGSLGRAGFSYAIARRIVEAENDSDLE